MAFPAPFMIFAVLSGVLLASVVDASPLPSSTPASLAIGPMPQQTPTPSPAPSKLEDLFDLIAEAEKMAAKNNGKPHGPAARPDKTSLTVAVVLEEEVKPGKSSARRKADHPSKRQSSRVQLERKNVQKVTNPRAAEKNLHLVRQAKASKFREPVRVHIKHDTNRVHRVAHSGDAALVLGAVAVLAVALIVILVSYSKRRQCNRILPLYQEKL